MNYRSNGTSRIKQFACLTVAAVVCSQSALFAQNFTFTTNSYSTGGNFEGPIDVFPVYLTNSLPDLVTADQNDYLSGLTNNGAGAFGFDENFAPYGSLTFVGAPVVEGAIPAYVNGPGASNLDIIVLSDYGTLQEYPNEMDIWANNGTGFNQQVATVEGGNWLVSITTANISNSNKPDVIASYDTTDLALYTNNDHGSFNFYATFPVGYEPVDLIAADLNSNGTMEVVSANYGTNTLAVTPIIGGQPPSIGPGFTLTVGSEPRSLVAADLRGSGRLDLVSANYGSDSLTVYTNNGNGGFGSNATLNVASGPASVTAIDLNGDGKPDLVCANGGALTVFVNNGRGVFTSNVTLNVGSYAPWVTSTDVNGDGKPDLVCINGDESVAVLINTTVLWLKIAAANNQISLDWPNWATNYFLEFTTNLITPNWTMVNNAIPTAGTVTLTNSWPAAFFRLQQF